MSAATVATTAAPQGAAALRFVSADTTTGIVAYATPSAHDAGRTNIASLDTQTGATYCDCKAGECHKACWHLAAVAVVWDAEPARLAVIWLTDAQLVRYGTKHALCVATYQARTGRSLASDRIALLVARAEYRRRVRLGLIARPTPVDAPLAA